MEMRIASATDKLLQGITLATKLWLSIALVILLALIIIRVAFQLDQHQITEQQLQTLGAAISQQTASSSVALILASDELSLSINLQQLTTSPQISGAEVIDRKGNILAQAGKPSTLFQETTILSEQTRLGVVRIHLNPEADDYSLTLPLTSAMSAVSILLLLLAIFIYTQHLSRPLQALLTAAEQLTTGDLISPLDQQRHDELGQIAERLNSRFAAPELELESQHDSIETTSYGADGQAIVLETNTSERLTADASATDNVLTLTTDQTPTATPTTFANLSANLNAGEVQPAAEIQSETITAEKAVTTAGRIDVPSKPEPSLKNSQATPSEQGYLLYVNHHVGGSDTLTANERELLLERYRKALEQVARLYKGGFTEDALGNWGVRFSPLSNDQSHGINALCAAQLFNALYRGINAQAIRSFSPALNMKLVILCGPTASFDTLAEDALLLSDHIQDNDLITHKALYQTPTLQERLLGNAKYRKFDDDTYLVSALNSDYQTLIDRQAEHFLKQTP
tara:strand:+ start:8527 stop:10065 length:1539 start_codon:yes stop_codon:yes gene_type:complete